MRWVIGALVFLAIMFGAQRFVSAQNAAYRLSEVAREQHLSDIRMCRLQLGIEKQEFHFRPLMMACVHETTQNVAKVGHSRLIAFAKAWDQCMPDMTECERALSVR